MIRNPHEHICSVYNRRERNFLSLSVMVIPSQAGIHVGTCSTPPIESDLPDYV
jgi:hypothetical protein